MLNLIGFLVAGLIIGGLARLLKPGRQNLSLAATLVLGVLGSLIGGTVATIVGTGTFTELDFLGFVVSVISSVVLIGVAEGAAGSRRR